MTDELGPAIGGYVDKPKQPRVMKQPTKDELRAMLSAANAEVERLRGIIYAMDPAPFKRRWLGVFHNLARKTK